MEIVEILVHVSAPSGGKDDANYRSQATAFLDFETVKTILPTSACIIEQSETIEARAVRDDEKSSRSVMVEASAGQHFPLQHAGPSPRLTSFVSSVSAPDESGPIPQMDHISPFLMRSSRLSVASTQSADSTPTSRAGHSEQMHSPQARRLESEAHNEHEVSTETILRAREILFSDDSPFPKSARDVSNPPPEYGSVAQAVTYQDWQTPLRMPTAKTCSGSSKISHVPETPCHYTEPLSLVSSGSSDYFADTAPLRRQSKATVPDQHQSFGAQSSQGSTAQTAGLSEMFPNVVFPGPINASIGNCNESRGNGSFSEERPQKRMRLDEVSARGTDTDPVSAPTSRSRPSLEATQISRQDDDTQVLDFTIPTLLLAPLKPAFCPLASPPRNPCDPIPPPISTDDSQSSSRKLSTYSAPLSSRVGVGPFVTHITKGLSSLVENLPFDRYFKPTVQHRDVFPLERGHWQIFIPVVDGPQRLGGTGKAGSPWSKDLFVEFYSFLDMLIKEGRAGDVTVSRDQKPYNIGGPMWNMEGRRMETVKVFCWGEVLIHIWLTLWVGSRREVDNLGAVWKDADGRIVIQMR